MQLALCFIYHHGMPDEVVKDAELIRRVSIEKRMPATHFFSGIELNTLLHERQRISHALGTDVGGTLDHLRTAADIALRNTGFCYDGWLTNHFYENIDSARHFLQG
ncbi:MAG: hypothetical protein HYY37_06790 [Candidatus Aenigmarchaeota archaeon]|nr:hypothetical protein [Candidatus Aenigmarchaeota archaeon]